MLLKVWSMDQNILLCLINVYVQSLSHVRLFTPRTPWTVARHAPLWLGFLVKNTEMGCCFLSPGDLPDPEIKPTSPTSPALQVQSLLLSHPGSPSCHDGKKYAYGWFCCTQKDITELWWVRLKQMSIEHCFLLCSCFRGPAYLSIPSDLRGKPLLTFLRSRNYWDTGTLGIIKSRNIIL